jgi:NADH:ubiquinone oxidoreductase subunit 2 (subunit N)
MPTDSISNAFVAVGNAADYMRTTITDFGEAARNAKRKTRNPSRLSYYWRVMRWMWAHRAEPNNRAKWRRMAKEIDA